MPVWASTYRHLALQLRTHELSISKTLYRCHFAYEYDEEGIQSWMHLDQLMALYDLQEIEVRVCVCVVAGGKGLWIPAHTKPNPMQ